MKAYGTNQFIGCLFHPCGNFPTQIVKAVNEVPSLSKKILVTFYDEEVKENDQKSLKSLKLVKETP